MSGSAFCLPSTALALGGALLVLSGASRADEATVIWWAALGAGVWGVLWLRRRLAGPAPLSPVEPALTPRRTP
jgi:hypothetical protein